MEEYEPEEQKPIENWNGADRRHGPAGQYKGDDRRKTANPPLSQLFSAAST